MQDRARLLKADCRGRTRTPPGAPPRQGEQNGRIEMNKKTVDDLKDIRGKRVLVRCDFNA